MKVKEHINLLGLKAEDKVTGFAGVITSISFDLYGCIQALVRPPINKEGQMQGSVWFDVNRLGIKNKKLVMEPPNFDFGPVAEGKQGPAAKPTKM